MYETASATLPLSAMEEIACRIEAACAAGRGCKVCAGPATHCVEGEGPTCCNCMGCLDAIAIDAAWDAHRLLTGTPLDSRACPCGIMTTTVPFTCPACGGFSRAAAEWDVD